MALTTALALIAITLNACGLLPPPIEMPTAMPTPIGMGTAGPRTTDMSGRVWHDLCALEAGLPGPNCISLGGGRFRADGQLEAGEPGVPGAMLLLALGECPSLNWVASATTDPSGVYTFNGVPDGTYCVSLDPGLPQNQHLLAGGWTHPLVGEGSLPASVNVQVEAGRQLTAAHFARDPQFSLLALTLAPTQAPADTLVPQAPTVTAMPQLPASPPPATATAPVAGCTDRATFVADVSVPDNTRVVPGATFVKIWRIQNSGTCTWNSNYTLIFARGDAMQGSPVLPLPGQIAPGATVDLSVLLTAPAGPGSYRGEWQLRNSGGAHYGIGQNADRTFWVQVVVVLPGTATRQAPPAISQPATATAPNISGWRGEYFTNTGLTGLTFVRDDAGLDFDWGSGSPVANFPSDNFSARWTRVVQFNAGTYRFRSLADDGVRLWVDERLVIDDWRDGGAGEVSAEVSLAQGAHALRVEYYEAAGDAAFKLWWETVGTPNFPDWKGEYWNNRGFSGSPVLVRNDRAVEFDWNQGAPAAGLPADDFSARWSRWATFEQGTYRFSARADDGVRVYVDGRAIIDEWHESDGGRTYAAELSLVGPHALLVEHFDRSGRASVKVWWEKLQAAPPTATRTPTPSLTPTITSTATITPTPTHTATATPTDALAATLNGTIWQDVCVATGQRPSAEGEVPGGCAIGPDGQYRGDGLFDEDEPRIEDVVVMLVEEECGTVGIDLRAWEQLTNKKGRYSFSGLRSGQYCLVVSPSTPANAAILKAGLWTNLPLEAPSAEAYVPVTLGPGEVKRNVNLGWDYLVEPEWTGDKR